LNEKAADEAAGWQGFPFAGMPEGNKKPRGESAPAAGVLLLEYEEEKQSTGAFT